MAQVEWHSWIVRQFHKMLTNVLSSRCVSMVCPQGSRAMDASRADGQSVWPPAVYRGRRGAFHRLLPELSGEPDVKEQSSVKH